MGEIDDSDIISETDSDAEKTIKKKIYKEGFIILSVNLFIIFMFSVIYYFTRWDENWNGLDDSSSWIKCFYFSFTTMTTIGYGDISAKTEMAMIISMFQQSIVFFQIANCLSKIAISKEYIIPKIIRRPSFIKSSTSKRRGTI